MFRKLTPVVWEQPDVVLILQDDKVWLPCKFPLSHAPRQGKKQVGKERALVGLSVCKTADLESPKDSSSPTCSISSSPPRSQH